MALDADRIGRWTEPYGGPNRAAASVVSSLVLSALTMNDVHEIQVALDLDAIFRLHYARLVRALTLVSGDRESAADAVQEAFVKAHLKRRKLERYDDPVGWIRRVAINRLRDEHRREGRKLAAVDRLGRSGESTGLVSTTTAGADPLRDDRALLDLLATLPRQQRLCVALHYVDELSVAEIAGALDLSEGAVKFHLHQGRERLRGTLTTGNGSDHV